MQSLSKNRTDILTQQKQFKITSFACKAGVSRGYLFKSGQTPVVHCHFTKYTKLLYKLLLGQTLAKNQGIFSKEVMQKLQLKDFKNELPKKQ